MTGEEIDHLDYFLPLKAAYVLLIEQQHRARFHGSLEAIHADLADVEPVGHLERPFAKRVEPPEPSLPRPDVIAHDVVEAVRGMVEHQGVQLRIGGGSQDAGVGGRPDADQRDAGADR